MGGPAGQNGTHPHLTYAVGSLHYPLYLTVQGGPTVRPWTCHPPCNRCQIPIPKVGWVEVRGHGHGPVAQAPCPRTPLLGDKRCNYPNLYNTLQKGAAPGDPHIAINTYKYHANIDMNK